MIGGSASATTEHLEAVGFLREGKAGKRDGLSGAGDFDANGRLGFRARFPKHRKRRKRFVVNLRYQIVFPAAVLLPHLPNLDFASRHNTTLDRNLGSVNNRRDSASWEERPAFRSFSCPHSKRDTFGVWLDNLEDNFVWIEAGGGLQKP